MSLLGRKAGPGPAGPAGPSSAALSPAQMLALLEGGDEALIVGDDRGRIAFASRSARAFGAETGQPVDQWLAALDDASRQRMQAALAALGPGRGEHRLTLHAPGSPWQPFALTRGVGGGWVLRAGGLPPTPAQPPLKAGATSELVGLLWEAPHPLLVLDTRFVAVACNRAWVDQLQIPPERLIGRDPLERMPGLDQSAAHATRSQWLDALQRQRQPGGSFVWRLLDVNGVVRTVHGAARWISSDQGEPLLLLTVQDITAAEQARAQAAQQGDELSHWFDLSPVGMLVYDADGRVVRSNAAFEALVGQSPRQLAQAPQALQQLLAWADQGPHPELHVGGPVLEVWSIVTDAEGRPRRLRARLRALEAPVGPAPAVMAAARAQPLHAAGPRRMRVMAVVEDRSLEDEHDLAQLEIGALLDTASVGLATYDSARGWIKSRPLRAGGAGGARGLLDSLQSIGRDQVEPASHAAFDRLQQALREGLREQVRYAVRVPDLGVRWLMTRVEPGELTGGRRALSVVTLDVTEEEQSRQHIERLAHELQSILDGTTAGIASLRGGRLVRCNRAFEQMLGWPEGGLQPDSGVEDWLPGQPEVALLVDRAGDEDGRHEIEFQRPGDDGAARWLQLSAQRSQKVTGELWPDLVLVLTDVTRLKEQAGQLEAVARERALMFNLSDVGIAYVREGRIERANDALASITGYAAAELVPLPLAALWDDREGAVRPPSTLLSGAWRGEVPVRRRDGSTSWAQLSARRVADDEDRAGQAASIVALVDIDDRHRARAALQLQAERIRAVLDSVLVGIVTVADGGIEWMNRSARRMFAGELADFVGEPISIVATDEPDHPLRKDHYVDALADGQSETFECRLRGRDQREFWVVGNAVVTGREGMGGGRGAFTPKDAGSGGAQITFALLDIERRRQAEVSIAQTQASLQRIIDTAPLAIALFDVGSARVRRLNQRAAMFFGRPAGRILDQPPEAWFPPAEAAELRRRLRQVFEQGEGLRYETERMAPDLVVAAAEADTEPGGPASVWDDAPPLDAGAIDPAAHSVPRSWDVRIVSLPATGHGEAQALLVASDVTEHRAAEQARLEHAIAQRDMLVKEVHHRIKNNLQGVAGLLQQTAARRPEVADLIGEAVGQVQAIAQVHGLQVGSDGPVRVQALVEAVVLAVQRTFGRAIEVGTSGGAERLRYTLPEAESIPIALTINELLTNAIKHGDPSHAVQCEVIGQGERLQLVVRNRGRLREGFSLAQVPPGVSGLGLVRALLPRRTAVLSLQAAGPWVEARVELMPPSVQVEPAAAAE